ncbi:MAG: TetR/AcrR family transcriptional regulator [Anaerolineales bacterium]|nr:TetR/AcrR family transcriptional regulator [Anaerolineales bacterium]
MNRDHILEAAAQIFRQKGFHVTSMQDIAEAVNLQKASLYHHVSSKQEILLDLLDQALDLLTERLLMVIQQDLPADEKLRAAVRCYLGALAEHSDLVSVMILEYRSLDPENLARHVPRRDRFERLWRDLVKEGTNSGKFCMTDSTMAARTLLGVMNWTITWYRPTGPLTMQQIADQIASLFLNGLLCRP